MKKSARFCIFSLSIAALFIGLTGGVSLPARNLDEEKSYFWAEASPVGERVCPKRKVTLLYNLMFRGSDYERESRSKGSFPLPSLSHPAIKITTTNGTVSGVKDLNDTYKGNSPYDDLFQSWNDIFYFTPEQKGKATVKLEAHYLSFVAYTKWTINVQEDCRYSVEINADESNFKMPSGKTVNEEQHDWSIKMFIDGLAKRVLADPLVNEGGSGGQKRLMPFVLASHPFQDEAEGTLEYFADGVWLGNEPDITCGTNGALVCSTTFTVNPVVNDETINFEIDVKSGDCGGFTVWCKGEGGGGQASVPPMKSLTFKMTAEIPREGGSAHYVHQLPYGITMDYLISAYPEEEE
jgi:hypothetical protein